MYNLILVKLSEGCEKLISSGNNSTCPTISTLKTYDTSNQNQVGKFIQKPDGSWIRSSPTIKNWWSFINKTGTPVVCVECDYDYSLLDMAQLIMIEPNQFSYASLSPYQNDTIPWTIFNGTQYVTRQIQDLTNSYTLDVNSNRYVTPDCLNANISYSPMLLSDTISYLENGCTKTNLRLNSTLTVPLHPFDLQHCVQCNYQKWLSQAKQNNIGNCITNKCQTITDPNSNPGFRFGK